MKRSSNARDCEQPHRLTLDYMMIVGKYFTCNSDYISLMKVCKRYKRIVLMYRYNPISDCRLFRNIQTQHFYQYRDVFYRNRGMFMYVYWVNKCIINDYLKLIDCSKCTFKNAKLNKMIKYACEMGDIVNVINCFPNCDLINTLLPLRTAVVVFEYSDVHFGFKMCNGLHSHDSVCFINGFVVSKGALITTVHDLEEKLIVNKSTVHFTGDQVIVQLEERLCKQYNLPLVMNVIDWCVIQYN